MSSYQAPPSLIENATSSDTDVTEGSSVSLHCTATGVPKPEVKWRREDGQPIKLDSSINKGLN